MGHTPGTPVLGGRNKVDASQGFLVKPFSSKERREPPDEHGEELTAVRSTESCPLKNLTLWAPQLRQLMEPRSPQQSWKIYLCTHFAFPSLPQHWLAIPRTIPALASTECSLLPQSRHHRKILQGQLLNAGKPCLLFTSSSFVELRRSVTDSRQPCNIRVPRCFGENSCISSQVW